MSTPDKPTMGTTTTQRDQGAFTDEDCVDDDDEDSTGTESGSGSASTTTEGATNVISLKRQTSPLDMLPQKKTRQQTKIACLRCQKRKGKVCVSVHALLAFLLSSRLSFAGARKKNNTDNESNLLTWHSQWTFSVVESVLSVLTANSESSTVVGMYVMVRHAAPSSPSDSKKHQPNRAIWMFYSEFCEAALMKKRLSYLLGCALARA